MRETLIAHIRSVVEWVKSGQNENESADGLSHRQEFHTVAWEGGPRIQYGYGYHQPDMVLYSPTPSATPQEMSIEDGVDAFLKAARAGK